MGISIRFIWHWSFAYKSRYRAVHWRVQLPKQAALIWIEDLDTRILQVVKKQITRDNRLLGRRWEPIKFKNQRCGQPDAMQPLTRGAATRAKKEGQRQHSRI